MSFAKTIHSDFSGHEMHVSEIPAANLPALKGKEMSDDDYIEAPLLNSAIVSKARFKQRS